MWGRVVGASASAPPPLGQNQGGSRIAWRPVSKPLVQYDHISVWLSLSSSPKRGPTSFAGPSTWNALLLAWSPLTHSGLGWNATASGRPSLPALRGNLLPVCPYPSLSAVTLFVYCLLIQPNHSHQDINSMRAGPPLFIYCWIPSVQGCTWYTAVAQKISVQ